MLLFPIGFMAAAAAGGGSAPNTVTSLAAGTATTTTIPLTWVESGGTPTTRTVTQRTPSGSGSYVSSTGTFGSTGGTVTGLTSGVSYDFQVVESNGTGSSGTATLTNVSTASAAGSGPALTMTSATYATSATGFGQKLTGGTGKAAITYVGGDYTWELFFQASAPPSGDTGIISFNDTADTGFSGFGCVIHSDGTVAFFFGGFTIHATSANPNICDGAVHHLAIVGINSGNGTYAWIDGVVFGGDSYHAMPANPTLYVTANGSGNSQFYGSGFGTIDEVRLSNIPRYSANFTVPTAPYTWDANTIGLWHLDSSGASA